jgi:hypothetical protein
LNVPKPFESALIAFDRIVRSLNISYALIGGIAVILQGHDRATRDIDLTLWEADDRLDALVAQLVAAGFQLRLSKGVEFARANRILLLVSPGGVDLDVALGALPFEGEMIKYSDNREISSRLTLPVARPADLIAMKIIAGRARDLDDVKRLLELHPEVDRVAVREIVASFATALERPDLADSASALLG